jgi:hypothetical protein
MLRGGVCSFQALARRLRVFDFDVFFLGTAIVRSFVTASTTLADGKSYAATQFCLRSGVQRYRHLTKINARRTNRSLQIDQPAKQVADQDSSSTKPSRADQR